MIAAAYGWSLADLDDDALRWLKRAYDENA